MGYIIHVHGQEFNSFRKKARSKALHEFKLHRRKKFLYVCDPQSMWEWDVQVLDIQERTEGDGEPVFLGGCGATPLECCGGPMGYRLMLKRQTEGDAMLAPVMVESGFQVLAEACQDQPRQSWDLLRTAVDECLRSVDLRLKESGPLQPGKFNL